MQFDILSRHLNVFEPHFIEASAGTGKTFAIEHLVTRLLIEGPNPLPIEQILVVTFTKAATRQLKLRIRSNLLHAKEQLLSQKPSFDYLSAICQQGEKAIGLCLSCIENALVCYDFAKIYTLHGFCHRILNEFAIEAQIHLTVCDPDEQTQAVPLRQLIKRHLKNAVGIPDYSPVQIQAVLKKYRSNPERMITSLAQLANNSSDIAPIPSYSQHLNAFLDQVQSLPPIDADRLKADLCLLLPHYKQMTDPGISSQIDLLCQILSCKTCTQAQFDTLLSKGLFLERMEEGNQKVRSKLPPSSALHYPDLYLKLHKTLLPPIQEAKDPTRTLLRLGKDLQNRFRNLLDQKETLSPDTLLLKMEEALAIPEFVSSVRGKFSAAIIDEFQDTDPIQWNIFQTLFISHLQTVCLVGDPKQSIYSFRNADVYAYLQAANVMGPSAKKHLDTNFRSTPQLTSALNLLFSKAQKGWMALPQNNAPLDVAPVKAGSCLSFDVEAAPVEFFVASDKKGKSKKFPTDRMLEKQVFPYIASEILKLHQELKLNYHDIAILVKDRFQAQDAIDYLKTCGIPASSRRGGSILETTAFFALQELLAAVCSPFDMSKIKAALGGALIGWNAADLRRSSDDPLLLSAKARMQLLKNILWEKGFGPFFQTLLATHWKESSPLLQEQMPLHTDLRHLCQLLIEEEMKNGLKMEGFLTYLESLQSQSHPDDPRLKVPLQEEKGSVAIMTIHKSKGLEFDAVFALGIASRHPVAEQVRVQHQSSFLLSPPDLANPAVLRSLEELDAEKMRQLYVALTRAKRKLYIPLMFQEDMKKVEIGEAAPTELFFARLTEHSNQHADLYRILEKTTLDQAAPILKDLAPLIDYRILQEACPPQVELEIVSANPAILNKEPFPWPDYHEPILSFSSLAKKQTPSETLAPLQNAPLSPHTLPLGKETGHLLHLIFEKIFKKNRHQLLDPETLQEVIDEQICFSPLEKWRPVFLPWITALLRKKLLCFSLSEIPVGSFQPEVEFFFPTKQGKMKGFADLFFEYRGKYYLLDWKSNYLGPSDADYTQEKIAEAMRLHQYTMQAAIYADALKRYIKLFDKRPFEECFGGAIYYFVRGKAIWHFLPGANDEQL